MVIYIYIYIYNIIYNIYIYRERERESLFPYYIIQCVLQGVVYCEMILYCCVVL